MSGKTEGQDEKGRFTKGNKMGERIAKLTPELSKEICHHLKEDNVTVETVSHLVGISKKSFYNWLRRGARDETGIYAEFNRDVKRAIAQSKQTLVARIKGHSKESWQAAAWILERRWPHEWGAMKRIEHSGGIKHQHGVLRDEDLEDPEVRNALETLIEKADWDDLDEEEDEPLTDED